MTEQQQDGSLEVPREHEGLLVRRGIEERLVVAQSPEEAVAWAQVIEEIRRQEDLARGREFQRASVGAAAAS